MPKTFVDTPGQTADNRMQLVAAILLGLAATFTAFSAYETSSQSGKTLRGYTNSTRTLNDANGYYTQANQEVAIDVQMFTAYETAKHQDDLELAEFIKSTMTDELAQAVDWWEKHPDVVSPLDEVKGNPYSVEAEEIAADLEEKAGRQYDVAVKAAAKGGEFELATVLFALTLFFGGISTVFQRRSVSRALLGIGGLTIVAGLGQLGYALSV